MPTPKKTVRLLIIEESQNDAEQLINVFRNSGRATRAHRTISAEALEEELNNQTWDLLLATESSDEISAEQALGMIQSLQKDIPVLLLLPDPDSQQITDALQKGFKDVVPYDENKRLILIANRELEQLDERRRHQTLELSLKETEKRCQLLLDSSVDAIAYVHDGMHIYANRAYVELFGYEDVDDLAGMPIIDMVPPEDQAQLKKLLKDYQQQPSDEQKITCQGQHHDGNCFEANMEFSAASYDGEPCAQVIIRVNNSMGLEDKIKEISNLDSATGLFNREYFSQQLADAIQQVHNEQKNSSLLYISLDNFSEIREKAGISGTDLVLADFSGLLKKHLPAPNVLARHGDDVFLALINTGITDTLEKTANQVCQSVEAHMSEVSGVTIQSHCSIGIALINESITNADQAITKAQRAAAQAKQLGGNRAHLHNPKDDIAAQAHCGDIAAIVQQALDDDSFKLLFQPVISLRGDPHEHYSVLLRLINSDQQAISPVEFMPVAKETGQSTQIDRWSIQQSIKLLSEHRAKGHDTRLFIHLSSESIMDPELPPWLGAALKAANLPKDVLIFEISEQNASTHLKQAQILINAINDQNCHVSLGQFSGTEASFKLLQHLDVSFVKLHGSFSEEINNSKAFETMKDMVSTLQGQGKLTITPMVENAYMLSSLWQAGVNYIQGYYLQRPAETMSYDFSNEI